MAGRSEPGRPVDRAELAHSAVELAPSLLGWRLISDSADGSVVLRITECEAYEGERDPGSHAYRGRTARTAVMFGLAGHAYVYFTYGMHHCVNIVCGVEGVASAVLLRAGEVIDGLELARSRRTSSQGDDDLARGPGRLTLALGIDRADDGIDLLAPDSAVRLEPGEPVSADWIGTGPRTGVSGPGGDGTAFPWRFWLRGEPTVSPYRKAVPRRARTAAMPASEAPETAERGGSVRANGRSTSRI